MGRDGGWRPLLRLAWRDAVRAKARSALVLVLVALPVLGVVAADVVIATSRVSGSEAIERRLGTADALVSFTGQQGRVYQGFDPDDGSGTWQSSGNNLATGLSDVGRVLGRPVTGVEWQTWGVEVRTERGAVSATLDAVDTSDPLTHGLFRVVSGRLPAAPGETAINGALADRGFGIGDRIEVPEVGTASVVGIAEGTRRSAPALVALPETFPIGPMTPRWLVRAGAVSWDDVLALNQAGASVLSRAVLTDPPAESALPPQVRQIVSSTRADFLPVIVLIAVMALIEVVLLAGPAFAVTARRQSRSLALMAASGGTPRQARRVVLGTGLVLGGLAAAGGAVAGIVVGRVCLPVAQRFLPTWFGPFDVPWRDLVIVAAFGLLSALLAAVVPATIASRQDVVAVLAGRRGDRAPSRRSPVLGLVLLAGAVGLAAYGSRQRGTAGAYPVAIAAIVAVLAMILLVPLVVVGVARLAGRLPLALRFAARDAARHRTRTVPAVAAVAATVAGVVALGVAMSSDDERRSTLYQPALAEGWGSLVSYGDTDWGRLRSLVERTAPGAVVHEVRGASSLLTRQDPVELGVTVPGQGVPPGAANGQFGSAVVVADDPAQVMALAALDEETRNRISRTVEAGGAVVFTSDPVTADTARLRVRETSGKPGPWHSVTVPAVYVEAGYASPVTAMAAPTVFRDLGVEPQVTGLLIDARRMSTGEQAELTERLRGLSEDLHLYVERGYQQDPAVRIVYLVLSVLAGVLMLGGTLTTTFLALSDARPDLATLSAVGAPPRRRRTVAASYAVVVGLMGAALGVVVGLIPGIAIARPLTALSPYEIEPGLPTHYLAIPWTLIGVLVVALPVVTALAVGLTARSRLPLVARLT